MRMNHILFQVLYFGFLSSIFLACSNQASEDADFQKTAVTDLKPAKIVYYAIPG